MKLNEQIRTELEQFKDQLAETEQKESFSRDKADKLVSEISRLQLQLNKLNVQLYSKDEQINALQQQLNTVLAAREIPIQPINFPKPIYTQPAPETYINPTPIVSRSVANFNYDEPERKLKPAVQPPVEVAKSQDYKKQKNQESYSKNDQPFGIPTSEQYQEKPRGVRRSPPKEDLKVPLENSPKLEKKSEHKVGPPKESVLPSQQKFEDKMKIIKNVETNLLNLQLEKKKLDEEYSKIVDKGAKTNAQRRRKDDLELELSILSKNISTLKQKLRDMNVLHQEY